MVIAPGAENYQHALCIGAEIFQRIKNHPVKAGKPTGLCEKGGLWPSYDHFRHALEMVSEAIAHSGLTAGKDIGIAIDFAADGFYETGHYWLNGKEGRGQTSDDYLATLTSLIKEFPIMSLEDPLAVEDRAGYRKLMQLSGRQVQIISDDLFGFRPATGAVRGCCFIVQFHHDQAGKVWHLNKDDFGIKSCAKQRLGSHHGRALY